MTLDLVDRLAVLFPAVCEDSQQHFFASGYSSVWALRELGFEAVLLREPFGYDIYSCWLATGEAPHWFFSMENEIHEAHKPASPMAFLYICRSRIVPPLDFHRLNNEALAPYRDLLLPLIDFHEVLKFCS